MDKKWLVLDRMNIEIYIKGQWRVNYEFRGLNKSFYDHYAVNHEENFDRKLKQRIRHFFLNGCGERISIKSLNPFTLESSYILMSGQPSRTNSFTLLRMMMILQFNYNSIFKKGELPLQKLIKGSANKITKICLKRKQTC